MSQSTNAIIAFGFPIDEDTELPWDDFDNFETWWAAVNEIKKPQVPYNDDNKSLFTTYWEKKNALVQQCPVELDRHCSTDYPMWFLSLSKTIIMAYRGDPVALPILPTHNPQPIIDFCKTYNIEYKEAKWYLYSDWC